MQRKCIGRVERLRTTARGQNEEEQGQHAALALPSFRFLILISDRKVGNDFRDRIVPGEAKRAEHNGHIWSRASTKHGAILTGKNPRFLLEISIRNKNPRCEGFTPGMWFIWLRFP